MRDLIVELDLVVEGDSTSAMALASRRGLGKQRRVQTRYRWIQYRVRQRHVSIEKVPGGSDVSDILTQSVQANTLDKHVETMGSVVTGRGDEHKKL